jgi:hypothetical protein
VVSFVALDVGVGRFVLGDGSWSMSFVPIPGEAFTASASGSCH